MPCDSSTGSTTPSSWTSPIRNRGPARSGSGSAVPARATPTCTSCTTSSRAVPWGPPFTLGHENAGWVDALGPGVDRRRDRRAGRGLRAVGLRPLPPCAQGLENYCVRQAELAAAGRPRRRRRDGRVHARPRRASPRAARRPRPGRRRAAHRRRAHAVPRGQALAAAAPARVRPRSSSARAASATWPSRSSTRCRPPRSIAVDRERRRARARRRRRRARDASSWTATPPPRVRDATDGGGADLVLDFVGVDATLALGVAVGPCSATSRSSASAAARSRRLLLRALRGCSVATTYWGSLPELHEVIDLAESGRSAPRCRPSPSTTRRASTNACAVVSSGVARSWSPRDRPVEKR